MQREKRRRRREHNLRLREHLNGASQAWSFATQARGSSSSRPAEEDEWQELSMWRSMCGRPRSRAEVRKLMRAWRQWAREASSSSSSSSGGSNTSGRGVDDESGWEWDEPPRSQRGSWAGQRCSAGHSAGPRWHQANDSWSDFQSAYAGEGGDYDATWEHQHSGWGDQAEGGGGSSSRGAGQRRTAWWWEQQKREQAEWFGWRRQQAGRHSGGGHASSSPAGKSSQAQASLQLLGLQSLAGLTAKGLKAAFLQAALAHHPDRHAACDKEAAERRFKDVQAAYAFLQGCIFA